MMDTILSLQKQTSARGEAGGNYAVTQGPRCSGSICPSMDIDCPSPPPPA